jgi:hypothetical protein
MIERRDARHTNQGVRLADDASDLGGELRIVG